MMCPEIVQSSGTSTGTGILHMLDCRRLSLHQEYFIRFVSTSPNASILEQASGICEQLQCVTFYYTNSTLYGFHPAPISQVH